MKEVGGVSHPWMKHYTSGARKSMDEGKTYEGVIGGHNDDLLSQVRFPKTATRFTIYEVKLYKAERDPDLLDDVIVTSIILTLYQISVFCCHSPTFSMSAMNADIRI